MRVPERGRDIIRAPHQHEVDHGQAQGEEGHGRDGEGVAPVETLRAQAPHHQPQRHERLGQDGEGPCDGDGDGRLGVVAAHAVRGSGDMVVVVVVVRVGG